MDDNHIGTPVYKRKNILFHIFYGYGSCKEASFNPPTCKYFSNGMYMHTWSLYDKYTIIYNLYNICMYVHMPSIISGVHHGAINIITPHVMKACHFL